MTSRDRLVIAGVIALIVLVGGWLKIVSPERGKVSKLDSKVQSARSQLQTAQSELSQARTAQARYAEAYASVVSLGKAVPAGQQVPTLVYELDQASNQKKVELAAIAPGTGAGSAATKSAKEKEKGAGTSFEQMPFTFTFNGSFADLYHLLNTVQHYAVTLPSGQIVVNGRLLTIQSFKLTPNSTSSERSAGGSVAAKKATEPGEHLAGTVTASAYVLPPGTQLTAGASSSGPAGSGGSGSPSSSSGGSGAAAATIRAVP